MMMPNPFEPRALRLRDLRAKLAYDNEGRVLLKRQDASPVDSSVPSTTSLLPVTDKEDITPSTTSTLTSSFASTATPKAPVGPPDGPPRARPPVKQDSGFFNSPPHGPGGGPPGQACLPGDGTPTYTDANGTIHNYTVLGGNCPGFDVGESGSPFNASVRGDRLHDPFFASITPQTFALAGATIASAILLILLFLSRSRKPWLQKIAALGTTMSLVTYMVVSVNLLERQYVLGRYDADELRAVNHDLPVIVIAYLASFAIYLSQVQTLMRIFPRKRDKVIIKWTGFGLIVLAMIFSALYIFLPARPPLPPNEQTTALQIFLQILPPLNYLFAIALEFIYMCCFIYFGIAHRRVAFIVPAALILALLSLACITIPIIFFCLDIWAQFVAGWGQFIRSIASIGSTVIVWEWVDRVEEWESKRAGKNGVLGRRIFEDEFEVGPVPNSPSGNSFAWRGWPRKVNMPNLLSGVSEKVSEWSLKLQSKLDRRASTPTPPAVTEHGLANLNPAIISSASGSTNLRSATEDSRTTTTGEETYTTYTGTSAGSHSPIVGGRRPKKKHQYPVARIGNTARDLTGTPSSSQSPPLTASREAPFGSSAHLNASTPSNDTSDHDILDDRPSSSNAPSFHSHESQDTRAAQRPFSVLPGFTPGDYFIEPGELEKRGWLIRDSQS